ncbi:hypothetical protein CRE_21327 [Caenorhabditis remanei]|uniref:BTB domain-containing protein n=1 Tax=Caenorhabditis remanei TaxID=31234 RepID=E3MUR7_CAERE|nr:hypothetical protein CRE_21327 [Caenorhabditis remanei]
MTDENNKISSENNEEGGSAPKRQRIDAENNQNAEINSNNSSDSTIQCVYKMCQEVLENQKSIVEKLRLTDEKLESMQLQRKAGTIDETTSITSNSPDIEDSAKTTSSSDSSQAMIPSEFMQTTGKYFVLKHVFKNVSKMKENENRYSEIEEHFGVEWYDIEYSFFRICNFRRMRVSRKKDHLSFFMLCLQSLDTEKWTIEVERELVLFSKRIKQVREGDKTFTNTGKKYNGSGWSLLIDWAKMEKCFLVDDQLTAEFHVKIKNTTEIYKDNLRVFDEKMEEFSDVVLVVNEQKFYVLKKFLAVHSSYFKSLFLGQFQESKRSEITLTGIDADDFQNYLELLYGDNSIDEVTVEGILLVADMYDTPLVIRKCEEFLLKESKKKLKKKLQMSIKYHLDALKKQCLDSIKSVSAIRSVMPRDGNDLDPSIMRELLEKSLALQNPK